MKTKCSSFGLRTLAIVSSFLGMLTVFLVAEVVLTLGVPGRADAVEADEFALFFEFNSTDGDLGLQGFLDADAWRFAQVINPNHRLILTIAPKTRLKNLGLNEVSFESDEPLLEEEDVRDRFPEGVYKLKGRTVDGEKLRGEAELSHELPAAPVNLTPGDDELVDPNNPIIITWDLGSGGETVAFWEFELETDEDRSLSAVLDPETRQLTIPAELIEPGKEYEYEVIAVGVNGNKTITETGFITEDQ